jgi:hypothetical protein
MAGREVYDGGLHGRRPRRRGPGPDLRARVNLTIPMGTATGQGSRPGEAWDLGVLDPDLARQLLAAAARSPGSEFCVTVTDEHGFAVGHGCCKPARPAKPERPGRDPAGPAPPGPAPPAAPASPGAAAPERPAGSGRGRSPCPARHHVHRGPAARAHPRLRSRLPVSRARSQRLAPPRRPGPRRQMLLPRLRPPRPRVRPRARHPARRRREDLRLQLPRLQQVMSPGQAAPRMDRHLPRPRLAPVDHSSRSHLHTGTLAIPRLMSAGCGPWALVTRRWISLELSVCSSRKARSRGDFDGCLSRRTQVGSPGVLSRRRGSWRTGVHGLSGAGTLAGGQRRMPARE